jgi:type III secretion system HrpE/YscL family protein
VADAVTEAQRIVEQAQQQAAQVRDRAREQGLQQGRADAAALLARATETRDNALAAAEPEIVQIAMSAAARIVAEHLALSPDAIADIVSPLLQRARRAKQIALHVHPDDVDALQRALPALTADAALPSPPRVEPDDTIARGGCILATDIGTFDARIEVQLDALARALQSQPPE